MQAYVGFAPCSHGESIYVLSIEESTIIWDLMPFILEYVALERNDFTKL